MDLIPKALLNPCFSKAFGYLVANCCVWVHSGPGPSAAYNCGKMAAIKAAISN